MISKLKLILAVVILSIFLVKGNFVLADWWNRSDVRPSPPSLPREEGRIPTLEPTSAPPTPSPTGRVGGPSITPAPTSTAGSTSDEDPCASGKSYVGPYCGWSPGVESGGGGGGGGGEGARVGGPQILGLSKTSGADMAPSDIILLAGVLCLLLYVKSKLGKVKPV